MTLLFSSFLNFKTSFASLCFGYANMKGLPGLPEYFEPSFSSLYFAPKSSFLDFWNHSFSHLFVGEMIQVLVGFCCSLLFSCQKLPEHISGDYHCFPYIPAIFLAFCNIWSSSWRILNFVWALATFSSICIFLALLSIILLFFLTSVSF